MPRPIGRRVTTPTTPVPKPPAPGPVTPGRGAVGGTDFRAGGTVAPAATGAGTGPLPVMDGLIDKAKTRLYLQLGEMPGNDVMDRLIAASNRGVDVNVVLSPNHRLDPAQVLNVLRMSDSGIEIAVTKKSALPARSGISDGTSFVGGKLDPVAGEGPAALTTDSTKLSAQLTKFQDALKVVPRGDVHRGLLPPEQVKVHQMPGATSAPILNAINSAKKTIDLEIYQVGDRGVIDALKAAAGRGVKVRVMLEPKTVGSANYPEVQKELKAAGIDVQPTPPEFDQHRNVDHAKFMLIDRLELMIGSGNMVRYGLGGNEATEANTRDFWIEDTRGQSLSEAAKLFDADWARTPTHSADFQNLVVTPDNASTQVLKLIDGATKTLYLENQSLSDQATIDHLIAARKRGVEVKVLLGVQPIPHLPPKNEAAIKQLKAAGIDAGYLTSSYLHAKTVITESRVFIGSQNFTGGGLEHNREVGEVLDDRALVTQAQQAFEADFADPGPRP